MARRSNFFIFLLIGLFMISCVSAAEFDNVKSYDPLTKTATITNAFDLPFIGKDIGTAKLLTPLNVEVGAGYQLVAKFELTSFEDYNSILKSIDFYDKNQKDWEATKFSRTYDIKFLTYDDVEVDDYANVCVDDLSVIIEKDGKDTNTTNTTKPQICTYEKVGSHIEKSKEIWTDKLSTDLIKDEKVIVGIYTNVEAGDYVEWIPTIFGVEVSEWATFQQSTAVDLVSYYRLDGSSGIVLDDITNEHGTNVGATRDVTGKIEKAFDFDGTNDYIFASSEIVGDTTFSASAWFKTTDTQGGVLLLNSENNTGKGIGFAIHGGSSGKIAIIMDGVAWGSDSSLSYNDGAWHHAVMTRNGNTFNLYIDGGSSVVSTITNAGGIYGSYNYIGSRSDSAAFIDGTIDEIGIWSRIITTTEIAEIYNSGTGLNNPRTDYFWDDCFDDCFCLFSSTRVQSGSRRSRICRESENDFSPQKTPNTDRSSGYKTSGTRDYED
jgi:hypothetical protein